MGARSLTVAVLLLLGAAASADEFWAVWGDGRAEIDSYRLEQPRYGQLRSGNPLILIYVTEDFSDSARVKADAGKHPKQDVYPVLKLNALRRFQTGIYEYSVMTSVFARIDAAPFAVRKVTFSSQEWCGQVFHELLPQVPRRESLLSESRSYFDGEGDASKELPLPDGGVFEDALPVLLRRFAGKAEFLPQPGTVTVPFLPSLMRTRLLHRPLSWGRASIARRDAPGRTIYTVAIEGGERGAFEFDARPPFRLLHYRWDSGEEATLLKSERLSYWKMNGAGPEGAVELRKLGLQPARYLSDEKP